MKTSTLDFAHRGKALKISTTLGKPLNYSNCTSCGQCLATCPTGALIENVQFPELDKHINSPGKLLVVQYSPAVAVSVAELLGFKHGTDMSGIINAVLRRYGFHMVFETSFGSDLLLMEQARIFEEYHSAGHGVPLISSSCPAWIHYAEQYYPRLLPHISPLKSPQQLLGSLIRDWFQRSPEHEGKELVSVVVSSCVAAKSEARKLEMTRAGVPVIDLVLTTRELARMIKLSGLDLDQLEQELPDAPFFSTSSGGKLSAVAGGEAEGTVRAIFAHQVGNELPPTRLHRFRINKSYREMTVKAGSEEIRMGTVSGLANAVRLLEELQSGKRKLDILEIMACPDGCVNGGGQAIPTDERQIRSRTKAVYDMDNGSKLHSTHSCRNVQQVYGKQLDGPGGKRSQELFFTSHSKREALY
jgi:iron only hydrogenase large subunit-like protein